MRDHTAAELRSVLTARGVPESAIDVVVGRFTDVGLVDDRRFATAWAESRHQQRHVSRATIVRELSGKGLGPEIVSEAVAGIDAESDVREARRLAERKLPSLRGLDRRVAYRRLAGLLARRGYKPSVVSEVVGDLLDELRSDDGQGDSGD